MNLKYTKLVIERSRFAAGQYDINLANEAEREVAAMQARIKKLENVAEKLANIIQWAMDDEEDFIYSAEGMVAIAELDTLKGDK